jgi:hypothetical protein
MKNVKENKREKTFTVQTANGDVRVFKTLRGAENHARKNEKTVCAPAIVTANTYFWTPAGNASGRRSNEDRRMKEIEDFGNAFSTVPTIRVSGEYRETCKNVYKSMSYEVLKNGEWKSTNITGLTGECARWGINLVK